MGLNWYQCKNCETTIKKDSSPSRSGCSKKIFHDWMKLAEVGDTNYSCKKCGTTIQVKSSPSRAGCPNATFHDWRKL